MYTTNFIYCKILTIAFMFYGRLNLDEIVQILEAEDDPGDIILFPPEDGEVTDEDSGDENDTNFIHLPSRMLRSEVEVQTRPNREDNEVDQDALQVSEHIADQEPVPKKKKKELTVKKWSKNTSVFSSCGKGDSDQDILGTFQEDISVTDCFELLYNKDVISLIADMSNLYALQRNHTLNVTENEIRVYIAVLLLTGYMTPKYMRMFWEKKADTYNDLVSSSIRRNRFFEIQQYLHLCDSNALPQNDKFAKVRKYFDLVVANFTTNFDKAVSSHISIDETIVPYYGRHSTKQHIHGKPLRFGYKIWSAATPQGYLVNCELYQGASGPSMKLQSEYGLGAAVILVILNTERSQLRATIVAFPLC
ncbi:PiggyBac transposable element-derived protein 3 [Lucilia cuprina]|nr:PiggyBac transposable element-derived protein 3 [Lucilia cuprina]